jgi:predicted phosphodiesterase
MLRADRIAVFGDVHLAAPGTPLAFAGAVDVLERWWLDLLDAHDLVVVNGDLWDLERGRRPFDERAALAAARAAWPGIAALEQHGRVVVLAGNHDAVLVGEGRQTSVEITLGDCVVRVEHGHAYDAPIKRARRFASLVTWVSGRVAASGMEARVEQMRRVEAIVTGERHADGPIERGGRALLGRRPELSALVVGHTHRTVLLRERGGVLANPGGCEGAVLRWTSLDGRARQVQNLECVDGRVRCVATGDLARSRRGATTGT